MASVSFYLPKLFQTQFGIQSTSFAVEGMGEGAPTQSQVMSPIGTPVYEIIQIQAEQFSYYDMQQKRKRDDGVVPQYTFPYELLLDVSQAKKIVSTEVVGRNGSVLEYIGLGDYQINIQGFIINYNADEYPDRQVAEMKRILDIPRSLKVSSLYLNRLGIDRMAIKEYSFPVLEGHIQVQPFKIAAVSDLPYELDLIERKLLK
ncbi:MAG: DUF6046 domain-containing protein [Candidatus Pedobacter colombiensis]|uniref:DUF6046 domain-containing protein n=1 Tax=Candidatus Pedobacter colombiensis TaxID=3121371 RepID=A0AAJ5W6M1_9SPHI|nr:DUF6046 domain-containing protein [Pedobacter sp.]WEK18176.1 MAG: DUF6046 domain-containing protein [Pedobacter sp.]